MDARDSMPRLSPEDSTVQEKVHYAIGDVHGEADRLSRLHDKIVAWHATVHAEKRAEIVHLGDYVDRGPDSRTVVSNLIKLHKSPPPGFEIVSLMGNHESMMLEAFDNPHGEGVRFWRFFGGEETLDSYRAASSKISINWFDWIDADHIDWMRQLPTIYRALGGGLVFVHAGIAPDLYPSCVPETHLWTRSPAFFDSDRWPLRRELENILVVHGHSPTEGQPQVQHRRINVDTGAVYGGPLTCAVIAPRSDPRFIRVER